MDTARPEPRAGALRAAPAIAWTWPCADVDLALAVARGRVFGVPDPDGAPCALDLATGAVAWRAAPGLDHGGGWPAVTDDGVFLGVHTDDGRRAVERLDVDSGAVTWRVASEAVHAPPLVGARTVVTRGERLEAWARATGAPRWRDDAADAALGAALSDEVLYVVRAGVHAAGAGVADLAARDVDTGAARWRARVEAWGRAEPIIDGAHLHVSNHTGITTLERATGALVARTAFVEDMLRSGARRAFLAAPGEVAVLNHEYGWAGVWTCGAGPARARWCTDNQAASAFAAWGDVAYLARRGRVEARDLDTGQVLWQLALPAPWASGEPTALACAEDRLVVGFDARGLVALGPPAS